MGCGASKKYSLVAETESSHLQATQWICRSRMNLTEQNFEHSKVLGKGKFGIVTLSLCIETNSFVAVKHIPKEIIFEAKAASRIRQEIDIASMVSHPFIVPYFGEYTTAASVCMVLQYSPGGELFMRMKKIVKMPESHAMFYCGEIALALKYLHELQFVYRDLKPENILLDEHGHVKMCDFGFAASVGKGDDGLNDFCGTAMYIAPEIVSGQNHSHGAGVDWWALGVVLYEMLTGSAPFGDSDNTSKFEIFNNINGRSPSLPMSMSSAAKALITGLLTKDPLKRFSWRQIGVSTWFEQMDWTALFKKQIRAPWIPKLGKVGDSSNFVDWSKVVVPTAEPSEAATRYCQGIVSLNSRRKQSVQAARPPEEGRPTVSAASQRAPITRRGSTGSFDYKVDDTKGKANLTRRGSVSPAADSVEVAGKKPAAKLKKRNTSAELHKRELR